MCGDLALAVAFLVGFGALNRAAAAPKTPAPSRPAPAKSPAATAQSALDQAKRLIDAEQPEAAAVMLRRFIESGPAPDLLDDAYLLMAAAMFGMKEQAETIRYVNQLLGEFPNSELVDPRQAPPPAKTHARRPAIWIWRHPPLGNPQSVDRPDRQAGCPETHGEFQVQEKDFLRAIRPGWMSSHWIPGTRPRKRKTRFVNW
ncbi:MAG: hypothetical protein MRJ92_08085 [Nitrospira sp.]|nr:hypothetical protein [Nitrospira sp.]